MPTMLRIARRLAVGTVKGGGQVYLIPGLCLCTYYSANVPRLSPQLAALAQVQSTKRPVEKIISTVPGWPLESNEVYTKIKTIKSLGMTVLHGPHHATAHGPWAHRTTPSREREQDWRRQCACERERERGKKRRPDMMMPPPALQPTFRHPRPQSSIDTTFARRNACAVTESSAHPACPLYPEHSRSLSSPNLQHM